MSTPSLAGRRAVVTGSSGLLGEAVGVRLHEAGADVLGLDVRTLPGASYHQEQADLSRRGGWEHHLDEADLVVHTAAKVGEQGRAADFRRLNVDLTENVVRASAGAGRLVHFSSVVVHGSDFPDQVDETAPVAPTGNPYTDTKIASEHTVVAAHAEGRVRASVVRPGDVYGPRSQPWTVRAVATIRAGRFALPSGPGVLSPVFVDDVARGAVLAGTTEAAAGLTFHLASGVGVPPREFFGHYARMTGGRVPVVPAALLRGAAPVLEGAGRLLRREPPLSRRTLEYVTHPGTYSIARAAEVLGWRPEVTLDVGMARTERWLRAEGLLG